MRCIMNNNNSAMAKSSCIPDNKANKMSLLKAVQTHSLAKIKQLVESTGISANSKWLDYSILNSAIQCGRREVAKFLLERNCRVNSNKKLSTSSNSPLHNAIELCDLELVQMLLDRKASITAANPEDNTPLHLAFMKRQENIVDLILSHIQQTSNYDNPENDQGLTHMHIACTRDHGQIIKSYLDAGVDIDQAVSRDSPQWPGFTALHFAVEFGSLEAVTVLRKASNYDYPENGRGQTALKLAYKKLNDYSTMVHILSMENICIEGGHQSQPSYFHMACLRDDPEGIQTFVKNGSEVNLPISRNAVFCPLYTPLHFAVESNCRANVELLLKHGAAVDSQDGNYMTPLHLALYNEDHKNKDTIVDLLWNATPNKDTECSDLNGLGYFHVAITRNDLGLVERFLENGEDVNTQIQYNLRDFSLYSPLHFAVRYQHPEIAGLLIKHNANVNRSDMGMDGTPLHLAFQFGNKEIIALLLRKRARANAIRPYDDKTMLHLLVESCLNGNGENSNLEMYVERLIELGCDVNARDSDGNTALHLACSKISKGREYVKLLLKFGADINLKNLEDQTAFELSFYEDYKDNGDDYMMLYEHVQKLRALGVAINPRNTSCLERLVKDCKSGKVQGFTIENLSRMHQQRLDEIEKLKAVNMSRHMTLLEFTTMELRKLPIYVETTTVKRVAEDKMLDKKFPMYGYLVKLQYEKGLRNLMVRERQKRAISEESDRESRLRRRRS